MLFPQSIESLRKWNLKRKWKYMRITSSSTLKKSSYLSKWRNFRRLTSYWNKLKVSDSRFMDWNESRIEYNWCTKYKITLSSNKRTITTFLMQSKVMWDYRRKLTARLNFKMRVLFNFKTFWELRLS